MQEGNQTPDQQPQTPPQEVGPLQTPQPPQSIKNDAPTGASPTVAQPPVEPEKPKSNKILLFGVALLLLAIIGVVKYLFYQNQNKQTPQPTSYEECVEAEGSVIQESYPATCVTKDGERFIQPLSEEEQQNLKPSTPTPTEQPSDELTFEQDQMLDWKTYTNGDYNFLIKHPTSLSQPVRDDYGYIGNRISFTTSKINPEDCRGDCPVIDNVEKVIVAGLPAIKITGYIGEVGGNVAHEYITYIFTKDGYYTSFTLHASDKQESQSSPDGIWKLMSEDINLFDQILSTFRFLE